MYWSSFLELDVTKTYVQIFAGLNKAHLVDGWRNNLMDGLLCKFGLVESAKTYKMICNHQACSKLQCFHSYFLFVFYLVYYLQIMDSGLHSSQFGQHLTLINWFFTHLLGCVVWKGSSDRNIMKELLMMKLNLETRTWVVF